MSDRQVTANNPTVVFVLGLLSLLCCQILGPVAWIMGNNYVNECYAFGIQPDGLGQAGRILGMVGTAIFVLGIVIRVALCFVGGATDSYDY